ncbi:amidohydrolase AmhX [Weizmannia acidilactici]|uniref:Amidohydrolase AmhX n=1 Tax=Weizmannia acidilactici TaxID=2607726 RepID=A0A5J4JEF5_9BACI|nr:M20 peptidase aminoacylase family protein [Weizmannia acidilactici]GER67501.1 amidohydrolase AmhX [Weizmannia acidilactici]GER68698.1 amidohydrolase AmhX [Weizmannia acidilactici]GER74256.1 amidohydrolase AmhX [Weizmannia acidilactici]
MNLPQLYNTTLSEEILEIFDDLHAHPELSMEEYRTTQFLKEKLTGLGCRVKTFGDDPGVVAEFGSESPVVGIRADMDALWQEVDGVFRANHSCGHDAHMAMVLGTLMYFKKMNIRPKGTIRYIFQPAEEIGQGAKLMIKKGAVNDLEYLFGVHLRPVQETKNGHASPSILHGASATITGKIIGEDAHASRPHLGTNAIEVAASLVNELAHIHADPLVPHSVKMTQLQAGGTSTNIIPGQAHFSLDLRAQTNEVMEHLIGQVQRAVHTIAEFFNVKIELYVPDYLAAATMNREAADIMAAAIRECLGNDKCDPPLVTTGGEDFHFYAKKRPGLKTTMLGLGCGLTPGLHHPQMAFDRKAILTGVQILSSALLKALDAAN